MFWREVHRTSRETPNQAHALHSMPLLPAALPACLLSETDSFPLCPAR